MTTVAPHRVRLHHTNLKLIISLQQNTSSAWLGLYDGCQAWCNGVFPQSSSSPPVLNDSLTEVEIFPSYQPNTHSFTHSHTHPHPHPHTLSSFLLSVTYLITVSLRFLRWHLFPPSCSYLSKKLWSKLGKETSFWGLKKKKPWNTSEKHHIEWEVLFSARSVMPALCDLANHWLGSWKFSKSL